MDNRTLIFTNDFTRLYGCYDAAYAQAKDELEENGCEATEETILRQMNDDIAQYRDDFWDNIARVKDTGHWLVVGKIGTWLGPRRGGKVFSSLKEAMESAFDKMEYVIVEEDAYGDLCVTTIHHDGINYYYFYKLSAEGEEWFEKNGSWLDRRIVCETLSKAQYRRTIHLRKEFGWIE